jgi:hypothetical protein
MGRRSSEKQLRRNAREVVAQHELRLAETAKDRGCLFCRGSDGGFKSVEHVFAESLGNKQLVLPRGVVCDRCNNSRLSELDQVLVDFMPIALRRLWLGIPNKEGRIRPLSLARESLEHRPAVGTKDPIIAITSKIPGESALREIERLGDGRIKFQLKGSGGRPMTPRYSSKLSRALLKSALECAWLDHGEAMLESCFDHIREAVLGAHRDGYLAMETQVSNPNSTTIKLYYDLIGQQLRMPVVATIYGVTLATDSRLPRPPITPPKDRVQIFMFTRADFSSSQQRHQGNDLSDV